MARLSTGQSYGDTNRATAAQLLGGIPMDASAGALAQGSINAPSLQPRATPVETFQRVGAPTLGGAPQFFAPPKLPDPGQDLANLARALGGFSTTLQAFGESYISFEKQREAQAKQAGSLLASKIPGAYTSYGEAVKGIEKSLAQNPGDAQLGQLLTELRAKDPRIQRWVEASLQDSSIKNNLATARERLNDPSFKLPSGRLLREVAEDDPEFLAAIQTVAPLPPNLHGDVWVANSALYSSTVSSLRSDQVRRKADSNQEQVKVGANAGLSSAAEQLKLGKSIETIYPAFQQTIQNTWQLMTPENFRQFKRDLPASFAKSIVALAGNDREASERMAHSALVLLENLTSGPAGPNGKAPALIDQLDKPRAAVLREFVIELRKGQGEDRSMVQQQSTWNAEDAAIKDWQTSVTPAVANDPAQLQSTLDSLPKRALVLFPNDPAAQAAYTEKITSLSTGATRAYLKGPQDDEKLRIQAQLATLGSGVTAESILSNQILDQSAKGALLTQLGTINRQDAQPYVQQLRSQTNDFRKRATAAYELPGNNVAGEPNLTRQEAAAANAAAARQFAEGLAIINANPGKDVSAQLATLSEKNYGVPFKGTAAYGAANRQPSKLSALSTTGPAGIVRGLQGGATSAGLGSENATLARQANTRPLYSRDILGAEIDLVLKGQRLSRETSTIIRRTGMKLSDYFIKQSELWGSPLPDPIIQKLRALDGGNLLSSAGTTNPVATVAMTVSPMAQAIWNNFGPRLADAFVPPASAADTRTMGVLGPVRLGTPVVGTPKLNANARAWLATISAGGFEGASYNTYYGGGSFDNSKGHPMRVVRSSGGIASSAAGRYQFMPDTWTGLHGGKNPPMTPARQDTGAYQLALNMGVDLNTAPPTLENVRKLSPVWAALPKSATGGAGYYKGQGGAGYARFRQIWGKELRRYSGR
jgi:muramidase (phage lysozyme)